MRTFHCYVDTVDMYVDADDKDEAMLMMLASGVITSDQAERMDIDYVKNG